MGVPKIVSIVGARPQFVKALPVSRALRRRMAEVLVHTGQHYDYSMSQVFFDSLGLPAPAYMLEVGSASHGRQTGLMLERIEQVILDERPDCVLVYGDTNSTLAGALAAAKLRVPVAHVEAGLRSYNRDMPEELNRVLTDHLAKYLFCPTAHAIGCLEREGIRDGVHLVGDVTYDAVSAVLDMADKTGINAPAGIPDSYLLATVHRPSNTDDPVVLQNLLEAFSRVSHQIVLPLHPRTKSKLEQFGLLRHLPPNLHILAPVGYAEMLLLLRAAHGVLTDSGGLQKEAYLLRVPCITLRGETEWVETVSSGWNVLTGTDVDRIVEAVHQLKRPDIHPDYYGDGFAAEHIAQLLLKGLGG